MTPDDGDRCTRYKRPDTEAQAAMRTLIHTIFLLPVLTGLSGCVGFGPATLSSDGAALSARNALPHGETALAEGDLRMAERDYLAALRAYERATVELGLTAETLTALGSANLRLARLNQAEDLLRQAIALDPRSVEAHNALGIVRMERGDYGEARRLFEIAYSLDHGESATIRENLRSAMAAMDQRHYGVAQ